MGWTVQIEDEDGNINKTMSEEFIISNEDIIYDKPFRLLKYLDPYGDTTFNSFMFADLTEDLKELKVCLPSDIKQIDEVLEFVKECKGNIHTYLKFYGD